MQGLDTNTVGTVRVNYKDPAEMLAYELDTSTVMPAGEVLNASSIETTVIPDQSTDFTVTAIADTGIITFVISEGGTLHNTHEIQAIFESIANNKYVAYFRVCIKKVNRPC